MRRFLRFASVGLVLIAAIAAASAQAAGNTKPYTANVRVESAGTPNKFRLTLTNDPKAQQALGSANFTLPANFTAPDGTSAISSISSSSASVSFNITVVSNVVQFRAVSSSTALVAGATLSADVTVTLPDSAGCTNAAWRVQAKQSNDFSGAPGNFMALNPASDLTPLGSFTFAPIGTTVNDVFVPQVLIGDHTFAIGVNALDTCGHLDQDYSGATAGRTTSQMPSRLQNVTFSALTFAGGVGSGSANISQANVEAGDTITVSDNNGSGISGVSTTSGDPDNPNSPFDVVQTICTGAGTVCVWHNTGNSINANSTVPGDSKASLGFGFRSQSSISSTTCDGTRALLGDVVDINPHNYGSSYQVTLVYSKSVTGNGPASSFRFCLSEDDTQSWTSLPLCSASITTKCIVSQGRVNGGALQFILLLPPGDPWGGVG